jgi:hypothetical protein
MQLHRDIDKIHAAGAEMIVIGNGAPNFIEGFREHTKYDGPLYTDPSLAAFEAAQLKRGVATVMSLRALGATVKAFSGGARQGATQGDAWQQGGILIVMPDNTIKWQHTSDYAGDNASNADVLGALAA